MDNQSEVLFFLKQFISDYKYFFIIVIGIIVIMLFIVKRWVNNPDSAPSIACSLFGLGRDYRTELQHIVDKYNTQMQHLDWVYGDYKDIKYIGTGLFQRTVNDYKSYIIGFGYNRLVIIPIDVEGDTIADSPPIGILTKDILDVDYKTIIKMTSLKIAEMPDRLKYQVRGKVIKYVDVNDIAKSIDREIGTNLGDMVYDENSRLSKIDLEQEEYQVRYERFIKGIIADFRR